MAERQTYIVSVYLVDQAWGGPEEGGWWYQVGELVRTLRVMRNEEAAYAFCRRLNHRLRSRAFGPNKGRRSISSVLSEGEYCAEVYENAAPASYPDRRPRYE